MECRNLSLAEDLFLPKQGKSEGFESCDRPSTLTQIGFKSSIFQPHVNLKFDGWPKKNQEGTSSMQL